MEILRQVPLEAIFNRYYRKGQNGIEAVPVVEVLTTPKQYDWVNTPERDPYLAKLSAVFDNFMDTPHFTPYKHYENLGWEMYRKMLNKEDGVDNFNNCWIILKAIYPKFLKKVYDLIIENNVADSYEEIYNLRVKYETYINRYGGLPTPATEGDKAELASFLVIHTVIINNIIDIFDEHIVNGGLSYLEDRQVGSYNGLVLSGDIAKWVLYNISMPEYYLINQYNHVFSIPKIDEEVTEVFRILNKIEEDYAPPVVAMVDSTFRDELVKGFMDYLVASETYTRRETLKTAFEKMRRNKGTVGKEVIKKFEQVPSNKKSITRQMLEEVLTTWWRIYYSKDGNYSLSLVYERIREFQVLAEENRWSVEIDTERTQLISPSLMRIVFLNNGMSESDFNMAINAFVRSVDYKATDTTKELLNNRLHTQTNLVRILDIKIYP